MDSARRAMYTHALSRTRFDRDGRAALPPPPPVLWPVAVIVKGPPWKSPHRVPSRVGFAGSRHEGAMVSGAGASAHGVATNLVGLALDEGTRGQETDVVKP